VCAHSVVSSIKFDVEGRGCFVSGCAVSTCTPMLSVGAMRLRIVHAIDADADAEGGADVESQQTLTEGVN